MALGSAASRKRKKSRTLMQNLTKLSARELRRVDYDPSHAVMLFSSSSPTVTAKRFVNMANTLTKHGECKMAADSLKKAEAILNHRMKASAKSQQTVRRAYAKAWGAHHRACGMK